MLFQSENFPAIVFKPWSPVSFGAWALLLFGVFSVLSALGARAEDGRLRNPVLRAVGTAVRGRAVAKVIAAVGGLFGFFVAGYTGVLLSVTNRPIWADTPLLGLNFLMSAASTSAALMILLAPRRRWTLPGIHALERFDMTVLVLELLALIALVISLGSMARAWLNVWGLLLVLGVMLVGIVIPLILHL